MPENTVDDVSLEALLKARGMAEQYGAKQALKEARQRLFEHRLYNSDEIIVNIYEGVCKRLEFGTY